MIEAKDLKRFIIEKDFITEVLDYYDFEYKDMGSYVNIKNPDGDNKRAVVVYKNTLNVENYTRGYKGDIFTFIQSVFGLTFKETITSISNAINIDDNGFEIPEVLRTLWKLEKYSRDYEIQIYDDSVLDQYEKKPNELWFKEGIDIQTQATFNLCYDKESNTIVMPIRDEFGNLMGIKNRKNTTEDVEKKYYYSLPCKKSRILFGLHLTKKYILEKGFVIVVEGEKTVMQLWSAGIKNAVAIGSKNISKHQVELLKRLKVAIVLFYDEDCKLELDCKANCDMCNNGCIKKEMLKFNSPNVWCVYDKEHKMLKKQSPMDLGVDNFNELFKNKIRITEV